VSSIHTETAWLGSLLNAAGARHRAVASNLANANTPGYRPLRVEFEEMLQDVLRSSGGMDKEAISKIKSRTVVATGEAGKRGVQIEDEIMALMKNQLIYDTYAQVINMKMNMLKTAITSKGK
jgi:flagellar basal-body rod protein FlgB